MQGECKKANLLVFIAEPPPFLCKKCGNGGDFLIANIGMQVEEAEPFFLKLVNGNPCFSEDDMIKSIKGRVTRINLF